ncbi:DNA-binding response regulator, NarL/FixJ family, contains REC and HTH domains [Raineyella antarctica]|uniref:DNA-binding response regulator, NarL/FixJ family, contains REC and HTH domains n=1 Tax=Raineyella antarctica TaxID=1577474 RepID=A0A1G6H7G2_9ACTN|nr:DNA-binding response regulator, NarL/FixJ family, contains REC and HTH domains [Raineyella antarctica]
MEQGPLTLSINNDHELVLRGLHAMLEPFSDRVHIVELDSKLPTIHPVDVTLYDTYAMGRLDTIRLGEAVKNPATGRVVIYTWAISPDLLARAESLGVSGVISKRVSAAQLVEALERVHAGEHVISLDVEEQHLDAPTDGNGDWPGRAAGLTQRQSEVIALINKGMSNQEIAEATYLSPNTVKSYIKAAYRTIGVSNRTQAVLWSIENGFTEDRVRLLPD